MKKYNRVLLKLSGESLAGDKGMGIDFEKVLEICAEIKEVVEKTNVEVVEIISRKKIKVDVFERGCGITLACGTGACASVALGVKKGLLDEEVDVILPGGELQIQYTEGGHVFMTGEAQKVYSGIWCK